ncbi:MAG: ATP-dependent nuclease [Chthoniobacterales bacterium]
MFLRSLAIHNLGPFSKDPILFEPHVTVITGTNDAGKTSLLNIIQAAFSTSNDEVIGERDINLDYLSECKTPWTEDPDLVVEAALYEGDKDADVRIHLRRQYWQKESRYKGTGYSGSLANKLNKLPKVVMVRPGQDPGIRQTINLSDLNSTEERLVNTAFGVNFSCEALEALSDLSFQNTITRAESELNRRLNTFLPPTLNYRFRFTTFSDKRRELNVSLVDGNDATTGLIHRGRGIQVMVDLLGSLAVENLGSGTILLLIDEPEAHLHADAQHSLRNALEKLGDGNEVQVIYVTHSPCMVNSLRPESVRLVTRQKRNDRVFSIVENTPYAESFKAVRSSLGLSPADSLLYAPVTILVEGKTEVLCLPALLQKISDKVSDVETLLSQCIIVEATGTGNLDNLCRIAKGQGTSVIAYIDGDRATRWKSVLRKHHPEIPVLESVANGEFEQIIPVSSYFAAIRKLVNDERIEVANWEEWIAQANLPPLLSFTKKIDRWLEDELRLPSLNKPLTMYEACRDSAKDEIESISLLALLEQIRIALR